MPKILITGSNSFVGSNIIKHSKYQEIDEVSLFNYKPGSVDFSKYDVIIHLVAIVHQTIIIPEEEYFKVNCSLSIQIAKEAKAAGVKQFIFMSTVKVYGDYKSGSGCWNETSICKPVDFYGKSKYAAELELARFNDENFTVSIVRTPLVYGNGVKANMLHIINLVKWAKILPFRDIKNRRNFTSAENLVAFIDRIIEKRAPGVYIAMDKNAISTSDLIRMISKCLDKKIIMFKLPGLFVKLGMILFPSLNDRLFGSYEMDNSMTRTILDFEPPLSTEEGIRRMIMSHKDL